MSLKVYFVGAHSTGKTTLTRWVASKYKLKMITEVARSILSEMEADLDRLRGDIEGISEFQRKVFARQIKTEHLMGGEGFTSDRSFDNLAYAAEHTNSLAELLNSSEFRKYVDWVKTGIVFFVRPQRDLMVNDGIRETVDWDSIVRIDGMIKFMLEQHGVDYLPIQSLNIQERTRSIEYVINLHLNQHRLGDIEDGTTSTR